VNVVVALSVPELPVPVIVTVDDPTVAVELAVNVNMLLLVAGFVPNVAVTPAGNPEAARVTAPLKGLMSVTEIVSVPLEPCAIDKVAGEDASVKPPVKEVTVRLIVVVALNVPEVPVIVIFDVPAVAVLLAVSVNTLLLLAGFVPNEAVTPLGNPEAARVTLPLNGLTSVIVIVSVPLAPCAIERVLAEGVSVKLPLPPQVTPFSVKDVGTALVMPFQVPLNPTPVRLPPAGMLPL